MVRDANPSPLVQTVAQWRARLRFRRGVRRATAVGAGAAGVLGVGIGVLTLVPITGAPVEVPGILLVGLWLASAVAIGVAHLTPRATEREAVVIADLVLGTHSLLATALELERRQAKLSDAEQGVILHAITRAAERRTGDLFPVRWRTTRLLVAVFSVAAIASLTLPFAQDTELLSDGLRLRAAAAELTVAEPSAEPPGGTADLDGLSALRDRTRQLGRQMAEGTLTRREASEHLGDIKAALRAQALVRDRREATRVRGMREAARILGRGGATETLGQLVGTSCRTDVSSPRRRDAARSAAGETQGLARLDPFERAEALDALGRAARAAEDAGSWPLSEALRRIAAALDGCQGDTCNLASAAADLESALGVDDDTLGPLAQMLDRAQARLAGINPAKAPDPRDGRMAGDLTDSKEGQRDQVPEAQRNSSRGRSDQPEPWEVDFKELYRSELSEDSLRRLTTVTAESQEADLRTQDGTESRGPESAQRVIERLPASYARRAQRAMDGGRIPRTYRHAVRAYFSKR